MIKYDMGGGCVQAAGTPKAVIGSSTRVTGRYLNEIAIENDVQVPLCVSQKKLI
jgi:excinuclease UvrABC ATPase subunit